MSSETAKQERILAPHRDQFLEYLSSGRVSSSQTIRSYRSDLKDFENFLQREEVQSVKEVDAEVVHRYFSELQEEDYRNSSIGRKLGALRTFFDMLVEVDEQLDQNPTRKMDYPRLTERLPNYLTEEEMESLLDAPDVSTLTGQRNRAIVEILYSTGLRAIELHLLNVEHVDQVGGTVRVQGKGDKERVVPIGKIAIDVMQSYLRTWKKEGRIQSVTSGPLIYNKFGNRLSTRGIRRAVSSVAEKAGLSEEVSPHTIRHSFATHMLQNGADLRTLQEMLGHENLQTTEIYTHIANGKLKESYDQSNPVT